jgi:hypothetical protein
MDICGIIISLLTIGGLIIYYRLNYIKKKEVSNELKNKYIDILNE